MPKNSDIELRAAENLIERLEQDEPRLLAQDHQTVRSLITRIENREAWIEEMQDPSWFERYVKLSGDHAKLKFAYWALRRALRDLRQSAHFERMLSKEDRCAPCQDGRRMVINR